MHCSINYRGNMKIKVTMKDLDAMYDAVQDAVMNEVAAIGILNDEFEIMVELQAEKVRADMAKWFKDEEYLTVEFDMETMTAMVLDANE